MSGNRVDNPAEPVLAALQALIEILQSPRCIIKYASQLGKLIFSLDGNPMFELSSVPTSLNLRLVVPVAA